MDRKFEVFGKVFDRKMTPETKEAVAKGIERYTEEGLKPVEGEIEKTPEELKLISKFNSYLEEEFRELGLEKKAEIVPERIHLLSDDAFNKKFPGTPSGAFYDQFNDAVYIDKESRPNRIRLYKTIYHESIHMAAIQKHYVEISQDREKMKLQPYRAGYRVLNVKELERHQHFLGLNEAVTDYLTLKILGKNVEEFAREFHPTDEEMRQGIVFEQDYLTILTVLIKRIAKDNNEKTEDVWKRFTRGYFTGEMMHTRDVDKSFGKGALRVLAALKCGVNDLPDEKINVKVYRYFETDDEKERETIADEILIPREKLARQKRKGGG